MPEVAENAVTVDDRSPVTKTGVCDHCGGLVESHDKFCHACGAGQSRPGGGSGAAGADPAAPAVHVLKCENCGAEVAAAAVTRSYTCPFCDSNYVTEVARGDGGRQPPEFVIGFAIPPEKAHEVYDRWAKEKAWFRPSDLTSAMVAEKLRGVYLPFWSFSMLAQSGWTASIGEYWYRTETYTTIENGKTVTKTRTVQETEWWPLAGRHHRYYSGFLVSGSRGLAQAEAERIKPFHLPALKRYEPYFLAGWLSEEYTIEKADALAICQQEFARQERANIAAGLPGDTHSNVEADTQFSQINSDLVLLPVYVMSYRYGEKVYRFLLNGQTGKLSGDKPTSWRKILAAVGIAVGVGLAIVAAIAAIVAAMK